MDNKGNCCLYTYFLLTLHVAFIQVFLYLFLSITFIVICRSTKGVEPKGFNLISLSVPPEKYEQSLARVAHMPSNYNPSQP